MSSKRLLAVIALVTLLTGGSGVFAGVALANHQWSDVPTGNFFHESISNFTDAGCASGFTDGTFHPTEPVLRQQMARFVNSCGGRLWYDEVDAATATTSTVNVASAEMVAGAVGDGGGYVLVQVSAQATSSGTGGALPCEVKVTVGSGASARFFYLDLVDTPEVNEDDAGSVQQSFPLPADANSNQQVSIRKSACSATVLVDVQVSATYWPFDAAGDGSGGA